MRKRPDLAKELQIDAVKIGRNILILQHEKDKFQAEFTNMSDLVEEEYEVTEEQSKQAFNTAIRKIEHIRNISSPILKVIQLSKCINDLLSVVGESSGVQEADIIFNMVFYVVVMLRSEECQYLGARLVEECSYIDSFMHEDQLYSIQQYQYIQHFKTALGYMMRGEAACVKKVLQPDNDDEEDEEDFTPVEFIIQQPKIKQEKPTSTGSSVLQKLKKEGLFGSFNGTQ